jgi:hypothetical protein
MGEDLSQLARVPSRALQRRTKSIVERRSL